MPRPPLPRALSRYTLPGWSQPVRLTWADWGIYLLVTLAAAIVLALRQPATLLNPNFVYEDGSIFFAQAFNLSPGEALTQTYAGYWHTVPRLVAEVGSWLPPASAPFFFALCALLIAAGAISWLILPLHRSIIVSPWLRLGVIALLLLTPRLDGLMLLAYVQWFLALWAVLVTLASLPAQRWLRWAVAVAYTLAVFTAPAVIVLAPIWLWRWWHAAPGQRRWPLFLAAITLLAALPTLIIPGVTGSAAQNSLVALQDTTHGLTYRSFTLTFLGAELGNRLIVQVGWWTSYVFALALTMLLVVGFVLDRRPGKRELGLAMAYVACATALLYLIRAGYYGYPYLNSTTTLPWGGSRYFFLASAMVLLCAAIQLEHLLMTQPRLAPVAAIACAGVIFLHSGSYRFSPWPDGHWQTYAPLLADLPLQHSPQQDGQDAGGDAAAEPAGLAEANARYPVKRSQITNTPRPPDLQGTYVLRLPIANEDWYMTLFVPNRWRGLTDFPEGLRLLDDTVTEGDGELKVDLFWLGDSRVQAQEDRYYTAFVHLLDPAGERVAGYDVLLQPENDDRLPEDVLRSEHVLALPAGLPAGPYHLRVGLYTLTDAGLAPGHTFDLPGTVSLNEENGPGSQP